MDRPGKEIVLLWAGLPDFNGIEVIHDRTRTTAAYFEGRSFSAQYEQGARTLVAALEPDVPVRRRGSRTARRARTAGSSDDVPPPRGPR